MARSPFSGAETTRIWGRKDGRAIFECPDTGAVFFDRAEAAKALAYRAFCNELGLADTLLSGLVVHVRCPRTTPPA